ncbi:MAG TPA: 2-phospho-L-lactate guanylyltransferase [Nitrososphaerales archaeon]|nr:2-phospho-L-lactate guanylyltransferase [Nitrososphaerales archaeon]
MTPARSRSTAVVIPVKGENPKSRLASMLTPPQRRQLQIAMLEDTLQTLIKAKMIRHTFVVSSDARILEFVKRFGAVAVPEPGDAGVNSAVERGLSATLEHESRMVLPADLPLLAAEDLRAPPMLRREGAQVVISPSEAFDGTNMLLVSGDVDLALHYDDDSFRRHFEEATSRGLRAAVYYSRGVAFDIDSPADVHRFFRHAKRGSTLTLLARTLRRPRREPARR